MSLNVVCLAKPIGNRKAVGTKSTERIKGFGPKPYIPMKKELENDERKYTMYMARKAWHRMADDLFVELIEKSIEFTYIECRK
jgi:hypothetical protein